MKANTYFRQIGADIKPGIFADISVPSANLHASPKLGIAATNSLNLLSCSKTLFFCFCSLTLPDALCKVHPKHQRP